MFKRTCLALSVCAVVLVISGRPTQAAWSDAGFTRAHGASSLIVSIKKKHKHKDNDNDANGDHHNHKKAEDNDDGLTQCSIQAPSGGKGCVAPFKLVCEKMESGKKCCGCVPDKNAKVTQPATMTKPPESNRQCFPLLLTKRDEFKKTCAANFPHGEGVCPDAVAAGSDSTICCCIFDKK